MKRIAKSRPGRLAGVLVAAAASVHRTIAGRPSARTRLGRDGATRTRGTRTSSAPRTSLVPAHGGHLEWIARLLREGAAHGSFDAELATESLAARVFFDNLDRMLRTGSFLSDRGTCPASGYVFLVEREGRPPVPAGFVLFKSFGDSSFELWLCGIERRYRGRGFCSAMLAAALRTPAGMLAHVARVHRSGRDSGAISKALERNGYRAAHEGPEVRWFVRKDAPDEIVRRARAA
ncbi:MAG: hypothetical protein U1F41_06500 [Burkholderiales bacterium]